MKPFTRSIIDLFDGKRRYLIPLYQRQYSWRETPQIALLWEDIERAVKRIEVDRSSLIPHFMGAIVISQVKTFGKQVQAFEVIDGQQRLTTFQLLLAALRDVAEEHGSSYAREIGKYLLNDGVMEKEEEERYKLWPSITDRRALVKLVDSTADLSNIAGLAENDELVGKASTAAYDAFRRRIDVHVNAGGDYQESRLETLFEAMKSGLAVVSIELEGGDDPQTIFETLNSRGMPLSPSDLLRNFVFQRARHLGQSDGSLNVDKLYEKHWLPLDRNFWKSQESRGRQTRSRLDWMLTDHLAMHIGDIVSIENLFAGYRKWTLDKAPFASVTDELEAISATAAVEQRLFSPNPNVEDPVARFGRIANAFDVSTAMPLAIYLATEPSVAPRLTEAFHALESYILRRDICGLTTKNYNRFFVSLIPRLRTCDGDKVDELSVYLSSRLSDMDRWPDDAEWERSWVMREQYRSARQPRLRYILETIERAKHTAKTEEIQIRSTLTIEHIMPQNWQTNWALPGMEGVAEADYGPELLERVRARNSIVNTIGNLTLITSALNSSVSNGNFSVKMPALRAFTALALNRELQEFELWDEPTIRRRGAALFELARTIWSAPKRAQALIRGVDEDSSLIFGRNALPPNGSRCRFTYAGNEYTATVVDGAIVIPDIEGRHGSFSAASKAVSGTSRNGWNDWYIQEQGRGWALANDWRKESGAGQLSVDTSLSTELGNVD